MRRLERISRFVVPSAMLMTFLLSAPELHTSAQTQPTRPAYTLHVGTSLVLVDVIAEETKGTLHTRHLLTDLVQGDFRIFDNGHEVPVESFDTGAYRTASPIDLWLVVQCNMGFPVEWASEFMRGRTSLLLPALRHLNPSDSVGVTHWCDDGQTRIDVAPQHDPEAALGAVENILRERPHSGENRRGELAMQQMIKTALKSTHSSPGNRLPIFLFLLGDHNATYTEEADQILEDLLESSGIVFGLNDENLHYNPQATEGAGKIWHLTHFYSSETGGQYYSVDRPELLSAALDYILTQVHLRYILGFRPFSLDRKRHTLKVELTSEARRRYGDPVLRFRPEYIPSTTIQP